MTAPLSLPLVGRAVRKAAPGPLAAFDDWRLRRRMRRELAMLPPYLLRDVGLVDQGPPPTNGGRSFDHHLRGGPHW